MKKIISIIIFSIILLSSVFAYNPTQNDQTLLAGVYEKVDKLPTSSYQKLLTQINKLKLKYQNSEKAVYLLTELWDYIQAKTSSEVLYDVVSVSDGDTLKISYNWKNTTLRLIWVDTPESFDTRFWYIECYGKEASDYLKNLLAWKKVSIELDESQWQSDKYDRLLVYVKLDWQNVNGLLIKNWYGFEYTYNTAYKYQTEFKEYQNQAKQAKIWLWATDTCNGERKAINETTTTNTNTSTTTIYYDQNNTDYLNMWFNCSKTKYCKYMTSCDEVKYYFYVCWAKTFDGDKDGIPCESICGSSYK